MVARIMATHGEQRRKARRPATRRALIGAIALALVAFAPPDTAAACEDKADEVRAAVVSYLAERGDAEGITAAIVHVSCAADASSFELAVGSYGRDADRSATPRALVQIGSNTKHFTSALLLSLEAEGRLDIDDPLGKFLPQYPFWSEVTLRKLLDMTSPVPNYSEVPAVMASLGADPDRFLGFADLVASVTPNRNLPKNQPWFYSNTNYILAAMVIETVTGKRYEEVLAEKLDNLGFSETYYFPDAIDADVVGRALSGYFENASCELYAPDCEDSGLAPLLGRDVRAYSLSWAGPAGGIIATTSDLSTWVRALFSGKIIPEAQLARMKEIVSTTSGKPIADVSEADPHGFALGLARGWRPGIGAFWFYQGTTLGYRVVFGWFEDDDLVVTVALNSQPPEGEDRLGQLLETIRAIVLRRT